MDCLLKAAKIFSHINEDSELNSMADLKANITLLSCCFTEIIGYKLWRATVSRKKSG